MSKTESVTLIRIGERFGDALLKVVEARNVTSPHVDEVLKREQVDDLISISRIDVKIRQNKAR